MKLKSGVRLADLSPQMVLAALIVDQLCGGQSMITSANDSKHRDASLHYKGRALDFRTHDYAGDKHLLRDNVKEQLGADFDIVLEAEGTDNEHLHVEYDPK